MWRRLYRQRRRLIVTPLIAAPVMASGFREIGAALLPILLTQLMTVTALTLVFVLAWPSARRLTAPLVAVGVVMVVLNRTEFGATLPIWADLVSIVVGVFVLPLLAFKLINTIPRLPLPTLRADVTVPLDPETALMRYTGRDGSIWNPVIMRIEHRGEEYDHVYREGVFAGMIARHTVQDYRPGEMERVIVTHIGAPKRIDGVRAEVTITARPVEGGTCLTLTERTLGLPPTFVWGAWLDDALGASLDHFAARVQGLPDRSTISADYRANGIDLTPPDQAF